MSKPIEMACASKHNTAMGRPKSHTRAPIMNHRNGGPKKRRRHGVVMPRRGHACAKEGRGEPHSSGFLGRKSDTQALGGGLPAVVIGLHNDVRRFVGDEPVVPEDAVEDGVDEVHAVPEDGAGQVEPLRVRGAGQPEEDQGQPQDPPAQEHDPKEDEALGDLGGQGAELVDRAVVVEDRQHARHHHQEPHRAVRRVVVVDVAEALVLDEGAHAHEGQQRQQRRRAEGAGGQEGQVVPGAGAGEDQLVRHERHQDGGHLAGVGRERRVEPHDVTSDVTAPELPLNGSPHALYKTRHAPGGVGQHESDQASGLGVLPLGPGLPGPEGQEHVGQAGDAKIDRKVDETVGEHVLGGGGEDHAGQKDGRKPCVRCHL
mmetsp:Transcript_36572/g.61146  ORF Transcript_36572/g.61146 Transcript_36572/m.61146 type:complete len:372 (-) Transcript_36572:30-1145(-)|eukprot:CAMPEP_0174379238 /NCGR_PEP_ID=MMETSP0811_2-20130205/122578_1 /TAXON_ID=73025 ORGANISM="Eutreptiella gymnastica-like, Strain CCMP1594" /NCGR_SAMPLE_ID=MMETSP0811_2 /ASSEMBLY_ACC=CAM_ASM_000667 /LENGTH=371 /DNA_ID=CAMNT_0015531715 /DNA_START=1612 /DNA_END=2727 /DNA_ORIENTATION=-